MGPAFFWQASAVAPPGGECGAFGSTYICGSFAGVLAPRGGARLKLGGPVWLALDGDVTVLFLMLNRKLDALVRPSFTLGFAFTF